MRELYKFLSLSFFCLALSFFHPSHAGAQVQTPRYIPTSSNSNGFYEYLPAGYETGSGQYPLMIFLHGSGEVGDGSPAQLPAVLRNGPPKLINEGTFPTSFTVNGSTWSFIVLSPQLIGWPQPSDVDGIISYAKAHYRVDANRIYLTGLSMGGGGVWAYAGNTAAQANTLAAILTVAGADQIDPGRAQIIASANLPVFATHNQYDPTIPSSATVINVNLINSSNPPPTPRAMDSIFPNVYSHDAWTTTYDPAFLHNGVNVYQWMLQYARNGAAASPPTNPLPVTLVDYQAFLSAADQVTITWTTTMEQNNRYFILQRSADGQQFSDLDTVPGTNQSVSHSYSYIDQSPLAGDNFYRLTQVDLDAKTTYYGVLKVSSKTTAASGLQISPNPVGNTAWLQLTDPQTGPLNVTLSDVGGNILKTWTFQKQSTGWIQSIDLSNLPAGSYFIRVTGGRIHTVKQLLKL